MTEEYDDDDDVSAAEPAEADHRAEEARQWIQEHVAAGWKWDGKAELTDPTDPDISMWFDPYSHEMLLSPKLVELLRQKFERDKQSGEM